jgi:1-acyl-sn-glycerol-3-phosphate acyltransferase
MRLPKDASRLWQFIHFLITLIRPFACRLQVEGRENVPATGGVVIASNHPGGIDIFVLGYASPRQIYYMAKQELYEITPVLSFLLLEIGAFPVRRGQQDMRALATSVRLLRQGKMLGMFPEGTRDRDQGLTQGRNGAVRIAMQANAPVVPVALIGLSTLNRHWYNPLRRPHVTVRFGEPIYFSKDEAITSEMLQERTDKVMTAIAEMLPEELRGIYAKSAMRETT